MGKRGPKPTRADGCHITAKGYLRGTFEGRLRLMHTSVWERQHGPIPAGFQVHHINHNKLDNRLENLQLVATTEHKRIHSGCELRGDQWWKPCRLCGQQKPINETHWYISPEGWPLYGRCRPCHIRKVVESKRLRAVRSKSTN